MTNVRRARKLYLELLGGLGAAWRQRDWSLYAMYTDLLADLAAKPCPLPYFVVTI